RKVVGGAARVTMVSLHQRMGRLQSESAEPPFPPPGNLIDVGGWRLQINALVKVALPSQPSSSNRAAATSLLSGALFNPVSRSSLEFAHTTGREMGGAIRVRTRGRCTRLYMSGTLCSTGRA